MLFDNQSAKSLIFPRLKARIDRQGGLHEFGYRLPQPLADRVRSGGSARGIAQRVSAALATECVRALDEGELTHPSQADVLAHALFGFPVVRGGLLRYVASRGTASARAAARVLGRAQP